MAYTRTHTRFVAGVKAPSVEQLYLGLEEARLVNQYGRYALVGMVPDPRDPFSRIDMRARGNIPVLRLNEIAALMVSGQVDDEGEFIADGLSSRPSRISGDYTGPGSELRVY